MKINSLRDNLLYGTYLSTSCAIAGFTLYTASSLTNTLICAGFLGIGATIDKLINPDLALKKLTSNLVCHDASMQHQTDVMSRALNIKTPPKFLVLDDSKKSLALSLIFGGVNKPNAFAVSIGKASYVIFKKSLIDSASTQKKSSILAHELGHIASNHAQKKSNIKKAHLITTVLLITNAIDKIDNSIAEPWFIFIGSFAVKQAFSRAAEFQADRISVELTNDCESLKVRHFEKNKTTRIVKPNILGRVFDRYTDIISTHPSCWRRVEASKKALERKNNRQSKLNLSF